MRSPHPGLDARRLPAMIGATLVGVVAFAYILLSGGRLPNDHYMHLALAQQVLFGDVPGRDFVDPGMPLMYTLSALVQHFWPGPFSEVVLTSALLAVAAALTFLIVQGLSGRALAGAVAAAIQVVLDPRLYGYPKLLVPAAVLWTFSRYAAEPTRRNRLILAVVTGLSILLRHDLGLFAWLAVVVGIGVARRGEWRTAGRESLRFTVAVLLVLTPYAVQLQFAEGVAESIREGLEFSKGEAHQLLLPLGKLPAALADSAGLGDPAIVLFLTAYLLLPVGLAVLLAGTLPPPARATAAAALTLHLCYCLVVLRHPLPARVADLGAVLAVVGVGVLVEAGRRVASLNAAPVRAVAGLTLLLTAAWPLGAVWRLGMPRERFADTRIADGWQKVVERVRALAEVGTQWPWKWYWPGGDMPDAIRYVSACTAPDERVLVTWFAPEYYFFARRGFAAGHAFFSSGAAFATAKDDGKMVQRMSAGRVPLVLRSEGTRPMFAAAYPELDAFLDRHYEWFAHFSLRDGSLVRLGFRHDLEPRSTYGELGWPCGFVPRNAAAANDAGSGGEGFIEPQG